MRALFLCLALSLSGAVSADELADANAALAARTYPVALAGFTKLANAGNAEAQLRLGEMYWYGEGVDIDRARGDALFARAAASGNKEAIAAKSLSADRTRLAAEITHWTGGYTGADLTAGKYNCPAPALPEVSKTNADIKSTNAAVAAWQACYNGFTENMNSALPAGKRIPPEVAVVMSEKEVQQAKLHLNNVYAAVISKAQASASAVEAQRARWETATVAAAAELNVAYERRSRELKFELEAGNRLRQENSVMRVTPNGPAVPAK
jgi:hypothetical protein